MNEGGLRRLREHWAVQTALLLSVSLAALTAVFLPFGGHAGRIDPVVIDGAQLRPSGAATDPQGNALRVLAIPRGERATAVTPGLTLRADAFAAVTADVDGARPQQRLHFLWTPAERPGTLLGAPLIWDGSSRFSARLDTQPAWRGSVVSVGLGLEDPSSQPLVLRRLRLAPRSASASALSTFWEWTAFEGLDRYSSNFVIGGSDRTPPRFRPVPAAAAWIALALALHLLSSLALRRPWDARVAGALVMLAWLLLDARFQLDLARQLRHTRERFAGKDWTGKRLADDDAELFRFAQAVRGHLPAEPKVVYLVSRDPEGGDRFAQLRLRYHLLPHNVGSSYSLPPREITSGEYLLILGARADIVHDPDAGLLRVPQDGRAIPVEPVLREALGALYRRP